VQVLCPSLLPQGAAVPTTLLHPGVRDDRCSTRFATASANCVCLDFAAVSAAGACCLAEAVAEAGWNVNLCSSRWHLSDGLELSKSSLSAPASSWSSWLLVVESRCDPTKRTTDHAQA
jgi:hypothetical protein